MEPRLTVIVPVYNAERYLRQCVDSILMQHFTDLELILIDDGSTDQSAAICDEYIRLDPRIRVLHQENSGRISIVRNQGLSLSRGEYLTFVDADDWIDLEMYAEILDGMSRQDADLGMCSYDCFFEDGTRQNHILAWDDAAVFSGGEIQEKLIPAFIAPINLQGQKQQLEIGSVCRTVFRRVFLEEQQIRFDQRMKYMEDSVFMIQSCSKAKRITIHKHPYYHYRQHTDSQNSLTRRYMPDKYEQRQLYQQAVTSILETIHYLDRVQKQMAWRNCQNVINSFNGLCVPGSPLRWGEKRKQAKYYIADSHLKQSLNQVGYAEFTLTQKMMLFLLKNSFIRTGLIASAFKNKIK